MPPQLRALTEGPDLLLDKPIILIGRYQECDIQIPSRKVSRRHCCIAQVDDHLVVRDLYSTNGVRINGIRVREGQLNSGDELTIANLRYQVCASEHAASPTNGRIAQKPSLFPDGRGGKRRHDDSLESCEQPVPLADGDSYPPMPNLQIDDQPSGEINQSAF